MNWPSRICRAIEEHHLVAHWNSRCRFPPMRTGRPHDARSQGYIVAAMLDPGQCRHDAVRVEKTWRNLNWPAMIFFPGGIYQLPITRAGHDRPAEGVLGRTGWRSASASQRAPASPNTLISHPPLPRARSYCMIASLMQLWRHGGGNHVVWAGVGWSSAIEIVR